jgi:hypothetical protein
VWQPATRTLASDAPSVVYATDDGSTISVFAADPSQSGAKIHLSFDEPLTELDGDPNVTVESDGATTTVTIPPAAGATVRVLLGRGS